MSNKLYKHTLGTPRATSVSLSYEDSGESRVVTTDILQFNFLNIDLFISPSLIFQTSQLANEIKVIGYNYPIYFANGDLFVREVYRLATIKPEVLRKQIRRASQMSESLGRSTTSMSSMGSNNVCINKLNSLNNLLTRFILVCLGFFTLN